MPGMPVVYGKGKYWYKGKSYGTMTACENAGAKIEWCRAARDAGIAREDARDYGKKRKSGEKAARKRRK